MISVDKIHDVTVAYFKSMKERKEHSISVLVDMIEAGIDQDIAASYYSGLIGVGVTSKIPKIVYELRFKTAVEFALAERYKAGGWKVSFEDTFHGRSIYLEPAKQ